MALALEAEAGADNEPVATDDLRDTTHLSATKAHTALTRLQDVGLAQIRRQRTDVMRYRDYWNSVKWAGVGQRSRRRGWLAGMQRRRRNQSPLWWGLGAGVIGLGVAGGAAWALARRLMLVDLRGQVALVTGGSRGLGLAIAEELTRRGAQVAICARDAHELQTASDQLAALANDGRQPVTVVADVSNREQATDAVQQVIAHYGRLDVLVNNAGIITVGPVLQQSLDDFEQTMAINFWGAVYTTMAALAPMIERGSGRIVTISSIGGLVAVPHLLPYSSAKFALEGFSEGLRAELATEGISVTTIAAGLMRTGSYRNVTVKGNHAAEYAWFALADNLPLLSTSVAHAARRIVAATRRGEARVIITPQAVLLAKFHALFPNTTLRIFAFANRLLPGSAAEGLERRYGWQSESTITRSPLLGLGHKAARRYNQHIASDDRARDLAHHNGATATL
ncbi:MAG: SDR family oxidoreductase [Ktedonobacterales bacterium]